MMFGPGGGPAGAAAAGSAGGRARTGGPGGGPGGPGAGRRARRRAAARGASTSTRWSAWTTPASRCGAGCWPCPPEGALPRTRPHDRRGLARLGQARAGRRPVPGADREGGRGRHAQADLAGRVPQGRGRRGRAERRREAGRAWACGPSPMRVRTSSAISGSRERRLDRTRKGIGPVAFDVRIPGPVGSPAASPPSLSPPSSGNSW